MYKWADSYKLMPEVSVGTGFRAKGTEKQAGEAAVPEVGNTTFSERQRECPSLASGAALFPTCVLLPIHSHSTPCDTHNSFRNKARNCTNRIASMDKQSDGAICTCSKDPRLVGVENSIQNTNVVHNLVSAKDFEGHDERIVDEIIVGRRVEDLDGAIVRTGGEEGILGVEAYGANGMSVIA